jgi:WD40 repeat protein
MISGTTVVATLRDGTIKVWDILSGRVRRTFHAGCDHPDYNTCWSSQEPSAVSSDGRLLGMRGWNIGVWDIETGERTAQLKSGWVATCAFSPDGGLIAAGFSAEDYEAGQHAGPRNETVQLWDVASCSMLRELEGDIEEWDNAAILAVAFSPDGKLLAAGGANHSIVVFDVATGERIHHFADSIMGEVNAVAFSPDGRLLASDWGLWDLVDPNAVAHAVRRPKKDVLAIAGDPLIFSPDGQLVACGKGDDYCIRLYDRWSGQMIQMLAGRGSAVRSIAFLPDDETLAAEYADGVIRLWDARGGQEMVTMNLQGNVEEGAE